MWQNTYYNHTCHVYGDRKHATARQRLLYHLQLIINLIKVQTLCEKVYTVDKHGVIRKLYVCRYFTIQDWSI
jgi:hypothetical protein